MQTVKQGRSLYLDAARVMAIISISLNHAVNRSYDNYNNQMGEFFRIAFASTLFKTVITVFSRIGVPLFLMITGALILNKKMETKEDVHRFYKHNLLSMFITAEIWYFLIYWLMTLPELGKTVGIGQALWGMIKTMCFIDQTTFSSMWYMPMILCLYATLPILIFAKDKLAIGGKCLLIPAIIVFTNSMVIPAISNFIVLLGGEPLVSAVLESYLFSFFYLYVLAGYYINKGILAKWRTWVVGVLALGTFLLCCGFQLFAYAQPANYLVAHDFPVMLFCAIFTFEYIKRTAHLCAKVEKPISYISRISFAIYFLHIVIMTILTKIITMSGWYYWCKLLFLEGISMLGSILIIMVLSQMKPIRKYLFLIK